MGRVGRLRIRSCSESMAPAGATAAGDAAAVRDARVGTRPPSFRVGSVVPAVAASRIAGIG